ncbi:MAG: peptidylprolyl isomerase [Sedimentisphaerales bacterium]
MIRRLLFVPLLMLFLIIIAAVILPGAGTEASEIRQAAVFQRPNFVVSEKTEGAKQMDAKPKKVKLETTMGDIVVELDEKAAPVTVKNFLTYVEEGFFDGTIFHRVIPNFMIQGGGFTPDMAQKKTHPPIVNEAKNGLKNNRGTIAMARLPQPDSATAQFFINHKDNPNLNYAEGRNPGYAVFGKVVEGMETVDKIAVVKTTRKGQYSDVPVEPVVIKSAKVVSEK